MTNLQPLRNIIFLACLVGVTGCAGVNRAGSKLDMAAAHLDDKKPPEYEGKLEASQRIGSMTSLQFSDGQFYDVADASLGMQPGDTVRIYKTDKGLEARLWKASDAPQLSFDTRSHQRS